MLINQALRNKAGNGGWFKLNIAKSTDSVTQVSVRNYEERGVIYVAGSPLLMNPMLAPSMETSNTETNKARSSK